jgi:hypothetical protein
MEALPRWKAIEVQTKSQFDLILVATDTFGRGLPALPIKRLFSCDRDRQSPRAGMESKGPDAQV